MKSKLILGTAQFGLDYGINNKSGQVSLEEVELILKIASENNIILLDTSSAYGNSELILGKALKNSGTIFDIVSKYPKSNKNVSSVLESSLYNLGYSNLYGYLIHHFDFYLTHPEIWDEMNDLKKRGFINKIGFSLYHEEELDYLLNHNVKFDIIQIPYNILDRKFESYFEDLKEGGCSIYTRSVFLQGLFFKDTNTLPYYLLSLQEYLIKLHSYCANHNISIEQLALNYVLSNPNIDGVLIGVDDHKQLLLNISVSKKGLSIEDINFINSISVKEKKLLNPVNWK